jgi:hypothetical protein
MSRFGNLVKGKVAPASTPVVEPTPAPEPVVEEVVAEEPVRARNESGHFIADDPSTPENEAWVGGIAPKTTKKSKRSRRSKKSEE